MTTTNAAPSTLSAGSTPLRLGFPVKVLGDPELRSNDARRWQSGPHLRVSLGYLRGILGYLEKHEIRMYRMSSDLAPYSTHPDMPQFHGQIRECAGDLAEIGKLVRERDVRLSFHPSQFVILNSPDPKLTAKSVADLVAQAEILDLMGLGPEAVLVIHVGGVYGDHASGCRRWAETFPKLPEPVRRRLVLENDDVRFGAADVLSIHEATGVPLIFDHQHYWCHNPERLELRETLGRFLRTWPAGVRPKLHYSSPRTEFREIKRKDRKTGKMATVLLPPIWTGHADFVNPFEFVPFLRLASDLEFDVMLEAKAKDLALQRVRRDLPRFAPEIAERFGLSAIPEDSEESEEAIVAAEEA